MVILRSKFAYRRGRNWDDSIKVVLSVSHSVSLSSRATAVSTVSLSESPLSRVNVSIAVGLESMHVYGMISTPIFWLRVW